MSKAIVIIDMPESCAKCQLFSDIYNDMTCRANLNGINYPYPDQKRQDWCPLRPVPEKHEENDFLYCPDDSPEAYIAGWNDCIDNILKDKIK